MSQKQSPLSSSVREWFILAAALLFSAVALGINPRKLDTAHFAGNGLVGVSALFCQELTRVGISQIVCLVALGILYYKEYILSKRQFQKAAFILSFLFSCFLILGDSFSAFHDSSFIFFRRAQLCISISVFLGYWVILFTLLNLLFNILTAYSFHGCRRILSERNFFLCCFFSLCFVWSIEIIPFLPGSIPHDGLNQLYMFFGLSEMNLHHPYYSTLLLGMLYRIGIWLGLHASPLTVIVAQLMAGAYVFSKICTYIYKKCGNKPAVVSLLFYAFAPMWWTFIQAVMKDVFNFIFFAYFTLLFVTILFQDQRKRTYIEMAISGAMCCFLRNNSILIILPAVVVLMLVEFTNKRSRNKVAAVVLFIVVTYIAGTYYTVNVKKLKSDNQVEAYSVPLQQIARYVKEYKSEISEEEAEIIDRIVVFDGIEDRYDPENADPVKNRYKIDISEKEFSDFHELYIRWFKKHPKPFLGALINHMFGYLDPRYFFRGLSDYPLYNEEPFPDSDKNKVFSEYWFAKSVRKTASNFAHLWKLLPGLSLIVNPAAYTWIGLIILAILLIRKRFRWLSVIVAPALTIGVCFISPVNGLVRYMLPVMASMPVYCMIALMALASDKEK